MSNQQQQQPQPIYLFISQDCDHSLKLINELRKKPDIAKNIQAIPIETAPRLPPNLTSVPTLLVEGKMLVGKQCFEWINSQGELEPGPVLGAKGFETSNYSFLGNDSNGGVGNSFSFIGQQNGSEGVNSGQVDAQAAQETSQAQNSKQLDFEALQRQRDQDVGGMQQNNPYQPRAAFAQ